MRGEQLGNYNDKIYSDLLDEDEIGHGGLTSAHQVVHQGFKSYVIPH